jgi:predicted nucleotidyltransferase
MRNSLHDKTARTLDRCGIPYMIIGGQALLIYGEPRLTKDIDITLGVGIEELEKVKTAIDELGLKPLPDDSDDFVKETMVLPCIDETSGIRMDFIFSFSTFEKQAIERAIPVKLGGTSVKFASMEDLVIHKIIAGRARDIEDIKSVLLRNPVYDRKYIADWLEKFDSSLIASFLKSFRTMEAELKK